MLSNALQVWAFTGSLSYDRAKLRFLPVQSICYVGYSYCTACMWQSRETHIPSEMCARKRVSLMGNTHPYVIVRRQDQEN